MLIWVLLENSTKYFYEHMGGKHVSTKQMTIGKPLDKLSFGWSNLDRFAAKEKGPDNDTTKTP